MSCKGNRINLLTIYAKNMILVDILLYIKKSPTNLWQTNIERRSLDVIQWHISIVPKAHYVYPCQRFSTGNTLEDNNP
jgi:homogentisate 1,2-dioxygenase